MRPNGPACKHVKILLGVYVLGGLRGHEETRVRTHLARCARCRAEYEELAELPALLDMITSEEAAKVRRLAGPAAVPGAGTQGPDAQAGTAGDAPPVPARTGHAAHLAPAGHPPDRVRKA
jgi:anti-sigma factor RsiW